MATTGTTVCSIHPPAAAAAAAALRRLSSLRQLLAPDAGAVAARASSTTAVVAATAVPLSLVCSRQLAPSDIMMGTAFMDSTAERAGPPDYARCVATVAHAIAQGIVHIDTYPGVSEDCTSGGLTAAAQHGLDVSGVYIYTKCDHVLDYFDFTKADALGSFAASTARLGGRAPHALRIHDPSLVRDNEKGLAAGGKGPVDDITMAPSGEGHVAGMVQLRKEGKIQQVSM